MYGSLKVKKFSPKNRNRRVWVEEIVNGRREIYIRCVGCRGIYKLTNVAGSMSIRLEIGTSGFITPCVICPHCGTHTSVRLCGYKKRGISDVFDPE